MRDGQSGIAAHSWAIRADTRCISVLRSADEDLQAATVEESSCAVTNVHFSIIDASLGQLVIAV